MSSETQSDQYLQLAAQRALDDAYRDAIKSAFVVLENNLLETDNDAEAKIKFGTAVRLAGSARKAALAVVDELFGKEK